MTALFAARYNHKILIKTTVSCEKYVSSSALGTTDESKKYESKPFVQGHTPGQ